MSEQKCLNVEIKTLFNPRAICLVEESLEKTSFENNL